MPHISATNGSGRVLQPDIPPPSIDLEHHPTPLPPSLTSAPPESMEQNHKSFWLFKRGNQNRSGPRNFAPSKRGAPLLERSLSEPNSPTEPTNSKAASRDNVGEKPNYIATALELLEGSKVRFDGHKKEFAEFNYRYHQLFANGQPIHGKIVKLKTPKPNAQDVAKLLVRDIQARLEELDRELESLEPEDSSTSSRASASKRGNSRKTRSQTPEQIIGPPPRPWYNPSTVNPVVLDKIDRRRSINPEGTWHGHSRNRSAGPLRPLIDFSLYENRNGTAPKLDVQARLNDSRDIVRTEGGQIRNKDKVFDRWNDNSGERERERKARAGERDRERDRGHHRDGSRTGERTPGPPQDTDRGRRDRHRHLRDNIPPLDYPSREEYTRRERQMSDPVVYTQRSRRRQNSPESIAPAMYTLAEDVEVRGGSSTTSVENMAGIGIHRVPRVPTVVAYPDPDEEDFELNRRNGQWNEPASAPPQTTTFTVPDTGAVVGPIRTGNETTHRRRRRSRSLGYELDGRANMSRPRSKSPRDRLRGRDRERPRERERDDREREKGKERERDRDKERERDRPRDKDRDRDRDRERERDKGKERERDRDRNKDRDRDRDRDREREKDKYASSRSKYNEVERERQDSGGRRDREREKDRDKTRDRERDREKDKPRDKDRKKDRDRERDKERNKDRERDYDYNQREPNGSSSVGPTTHLPTNMPGAFGPLPAGPSPGLTPPPPHTMLKFGVATNGPCPPNPNSESRFMEILTSPMPPIHFNLPGP